MASDSEKKAAVEKVLAARRAVLERLSADQQEEDDGGPKVSPAEAAPSGAAEGFLDEPAAATGPALVPPTSPAAAHVVSRQKLWGDDDGGAP